MVLGFWELHYHFRNLPKAKRKCVLVKMIIILENRKTHNGFGNYQKTRMVLEKLKNYNENEI